MTGRGLDAANHPVRKLLPPLVVVGAGFSRGCLDMPAGEDLPRGLAADSTREIA